MTRFMADSCITEETIKLAAKEDCPILFKDYILEILTKALGVCGSPIDIQLIDNKKIKLIWG